VEDGFVDIAVGFSENRRIEYDMGRGLRMVWRKEDAGCSAFTYLSGSQKKGIKQKMKNRYFVFCLTCIFFICLHICLLHCTESKYR
jgi:hypothetical protein